MGSWTLGIQFEHGKCEGWLRPSPSFLSGHLNAKEKIQHKHRFEDSTTWI